MIPTKLQRRLPDCGLNLCACFATLGKNATAKDAFEAWLAWLVSQGGVTGVTYSPSPLYDHWAFQIREAARSEK